MSSRENIKVAIHCMVYNHEPYLRVCLNGFVMQKTNFKFVAIVHDDASTDNSAGIIREYTEKYPDIIKPIYETENQYVKKNITSIMNKAIDATEAKYVAMCEGDDYWIDPYKLQKQVDFLEAHPDYFECFTNSYVLENGEKKIAINHVWDTYSIEDIINTNALNMRDRGDLIVPCAHTSTILYRRPIEGLPEWISRCFIGDEPLFISLAQYGKAKFINVITSVYRAGVGVSSNNFSETKDWKNRIAMYDIINEGLKYRYDSIITPIIAKLDFMLFRRLWKLGQKKEAIAYMIKSLKTDKTITYNWITKKEKI